MTEGEGRQETMLGKEGKTDASDALWGEFGLEKEEQKEKAVEEKTVEEVPEEKAEVKAEKPKEKAPSGFSDEEWARMSDSARRQVRELLKGFTQATQKLSRQEPVYRVYSQFDALLQSDPLLRSDVEKVLQRRLSSKSQDRMEETVEDEDAGIDEELDRLVEDEKPREKVPEYVKRMEQRLKNIEDNLFKEQVAQSRAQAEAELEGLKSFHKEKFGDELSREDVVALLNEAVVSNRDLTSTYRTKFFDRALDLSRVKQKDVEKEEKREGLGSVTARKLGSGGSPAPVRLTPEEARLARDFGFSVEDVAKWKNRRTVE